MTQPDRKNLLQLMDKTRGNIEKILPFIDFQIKIYPSWSTRELLAHITGWDEIAIGTLQSHSGKVTSPTGEIRNLDEFNAHSISFRASMDEDQIINEWRSTRKALRTIIEEYPEDKFETPFPVPWGGESNVTEMMEMFCEHEESHTRDIQYRVQQQKKPFLKEGE